MKHDIINLMNKRSIIIAFSVCAIIFVAFPVSAAGIIPDSLVPECSKLAGGCTLCDAWPLANNIINFLLFGLAIPVLTVTLIWGGVMWTTAGASPSNIEQGKKIMTSGIIGILIAFSGWLMVDTVIKSVASGGKVIGAWQTFPKREDCINPNLADEQLKFQDIVPGASSPITTALDGYYSHEQAIAALSGIRTNHDNQNCSGMVPTTCGARPSGSPTNCTSLDMIPKSTIQSLNNIKNIPFYISGGTEAGHVTHGLCKPIVDLVTGTPGNKDLSQLPILQNAVLESGAVANKTFCESGAVTIVDCSSASADHLHVQFSQ